MKWTETRSGAGRGDLIGTIMFPPQQKLEAVLEENFPVQITGIQSTGQRIIVTDSQESVHFVRYRKAENQLVIFCDDTTPRYVTTCCVLDYNTVAVGDKFGSISI
ncbi:hypothetical protein TELCIR_21228, partial [Teladorsagia circumcincta]